MADETPRPKRKRRRWIVAGVLLLVFTAWWHWPRGDDRLVGEWTIVFPNWNTLNENKSPTREMVLTLRRNGTGWLGYSGEGRKDVFPWSFDGKTLSLGSSSPSTYGSKTLQVFNTVYEKVTGNRLSFEPWSLVVEGEGSDSIQFDQARSKTPWTVDNLPIIPHRMNRVPE